MSITIRELQLFSDCTIRLIIKAYAFINLNTALHAIIHGFKKIILTLFLSSSCDGIIKSLTK